MPGKSEHDIIKTQCGVLGGRWVTDDTPVNEEFWACQLFGETEIASITMPNHGGTKTNLTLPGGTIFGLITSITLVDGTTPVLLQK